jgi:hypothetical protein
MPASTPRESFAFGSADFWYSTGGQLIGRMGQNVTTCMIVAGRWPKCEADGRTPNEHLVKPRQQRLQTVDGVGDYGSSGLAERAVKRCGMRSR